MTAKAQDWQRGSRQRGRAGPMVRFPDQVLEEKESQVMVLSGASSQVSGLGDLMHMPAPKALALRTTGATYPGSTEQVAAVRADLRGLLDGCPMADDVILCASELAANAALHSGSHLPGGQFTVRAEIHPGDYIWIEVEDNGGPWLEAASDPSRGHGLDIIRALASDWGVEGDYFARVVWVRFDWDAGVIPRT